MGWPQIVVIVLVSVGLLEAARDHGKPKEGVWAKDNFWLSLLSAAILVSLLYFGGFWG